MNQVKVDGNSLSDVPVYQENGDIGFFIRAPFQLPARTENLPPMCLSSTPQPQLQSSAPQCHGEAMNMVPNTIMTSLPGNSGDLTASSSLPQEGAGAVAHRSMLIVKASIKREHRLIKNRDASRECRRKKKEYVKCLEDRLDMLENQNKTLIDELNALKDIN